MKFLVAAQIIDFIGFGAGIFFITHGPKPDALSIEPRALDILQSVMANLHLAWPVQI